MAAPEGFKGRMYLSTVLILLLFLDITRTFAQGVAYCSSHNTGSNSDHVSSIYQSNGLCFNTCKADFAFAIVQARQCWCSNYAPAETTDIISCNDPCPGFPSDKCGSIFDGLFGYIAISRQPSGTLSAASSSLPSNTPTTEAVTSSEQLVSSQSSGGALSSSLSPTLVPSFSTMATSSLPLTPFLGSFVSLPTSTSEPYLSPLTLLLTSFVQSSLSSPEPVTVQKTVTALQSVKISIVSLPPTSPTPDVVSTTPSPNPTTQSSSPPPIIKETTSSTSEPSQTSSSSTSTWSATPFVSVMTVTGQVKTLTITPTEPPAATASPSVSHKSGLFSSTGKVIGLFSALAVLILGIAIFLLYILFRRKGNGGPDALMTGAGGDTPQRRPSRLSQMGLVSGSQRPIGENGVPVIQTSGWGPGNSAEKSPSDTMTPLDLRSSYPRIVDQRLDPVALWNPLHDNGSHISIRSFQDDQDYSRRMLRIANPDNDPQ